MVAMVVPFTEVRAVTQAGDGRDGRPVHIVPTKGGGRNYAVMAIMHQQGREIQSHALHHVGLPMLQDVIIALS